VLLITKLGSHQMRHQGLGKRRSPPGAGHSCVTAP